MFRARAVEVGAEGAGNASFPAMLPIIGRRIPANRGRSAIRGMNGVNGRRGRTRQVLPMPRHSCRIDVRVGKWAGQDIQRPPSTPRHRASRRPVMALHLHDPRGVEGARDEATVVAHPPGLTVGASEPAVLGMTL